MTVKLNKNQILELKSLATFGETGTVWPTKEALKFQKLGVVELGNAVEGDQTQIRISADGSQYLAEMETPDEKNVDNGSGSDDNGDQSGDKAVAKTKGVPTVSTYQIEDAVEVPKTTRRTRTSAFPFDKLEIGQSFFVAATEEKPDPAKSLASTVNGANARFSEPTGEMKVNRKQNSVPATRQLRKFIVRAVEGGARVWRTELDAE